MRVFYNSIGTKRCPATSSSWNSTPITHVARSPWCTSSSTPWRNDPISSKQTPSSGNSLTPSRAWAPRQPASCSRRLKISSKLTSLQYEIQSHSTGCWRPVWSLWWNWSTLHSLHCSWWSSLRIRWLEILPYQSWCYYARHILRGYR